jgi:hypothetical protein
VHARWKGSAIRLTPVPAEGDKIRLELWGASRKSDLLARLAGLPVELVAPGGEVVVRATGDDGDAVD